ncbi:hypothetical protein D0T12_34445 [Actinomadura spongiicola]|uniref:Uncharacterized protein n=1 Tax=Actinomadura spongiicola TaxID=2303421 RepID=A0A372G7A3_9ACTN|nr:hypothetical protein [Actinomadura spongiicola]RFS80973.1 hypothetical protein D0T12_34445 [Actinomadura spongiicola]
MGIYVGVRGWLQCDERQLAAIRTIIAAHDDGHYSNGWGWPRQHINWTHYVFFGADIREWAVDALLTQVEEIAQLPASDEDGDRVTGLFFATHESDGMTEWQIREGQVFVTPGDGRYHYLDA